MRTNSTAPARSSWGTAIAAVVVLVVSLTAGEGAAQTTDTTVGPTWRLYQQAFVDLADNYPERAARKLLAIRKKKSSHPASVFARPVLRALRNRSDVPADTIPDPSQWPPVEKHPAVEDRDSKVYRASWVRYREGFVALANGDRQKAERRLESIRSAGPPLETFASTLLDRLEPEAQSSSESASTANREQTSAETAPRDSSSPSPWARQSTAFAGGLGAAIVGGAAGAGLGYALTRPLIGGGPAGIIFAGGVYVLSVAAGVVGVTPLGVYWTGNSLGGNGDLSAAYAGAGLGSVITYEISHDPAGLSQTRRSGLELYPTVTPVARGGGTASIGFGGRF